MYHCSTPAKKGYEVTLFEKDKILGGILKDTKLNEDIFLTLVSILIQKSLGIKNIYKINLILKFLIMKKGLTQIFLITKYFPAKCQILRMIKK